MNARFEAELAARLKVLFRECPALAGFTVPDDVAGSLDTPGNITCYLEDLGQAEAVLGEVAEMLLEVVDEQPGALDLLKGRTFARTVH